MESDSRTVETFFNIDEDSLHQLSEVNGYWSKSALFYDGIKNTRVSDLTTKQSSWLEKIVDEYKDTYQKNCG